MTRPLALVLVLAGGFAFGLVWLFGLQFASGEAYPESSTMRTDPLGAKALYDSLASAGVEVSRNYQPLEHARFSDATVVLLGAGPSPAAQEAELYQKMAARGNRVVLALRIDDDYRQPPAGVLRKRWKVTLPSAEKLVERPFGTGAVAIVPKGEIFQNGSLAGKPDSALILQALGPARRVIFDESHLGMVESGSLVGLVRRYRLQGFAWGCALVVALFLWRSMSPFPPVTSAVRGEGKIAGRTSASGLAGLLQQNLPPGRLVETAWDLWTKGNPRHVSPSRRARAEALVRAGSDPLPALAAIHRALESKRTE